MIDEADMYENHVLRHFEEPYHRGKLEGATHGRRVDNPVCGDSVEMQLRIGPNGILEEVWFTASGCIISQASASMLAQYAERRTIDQVNVMAPQQMLELFEARLTIRRQQCCRLAWQALRAAIVSPVTDCS